MKQGGYKQDKNPPVSLTVTHIFNFLKCYDMEVGENRVRVFYGTEKKEGERLEIYTGGISPCSSDRVSDL